MAKSIYLETAAQVNDAIWDERVSPKTIRLLEAVLAENPEDTASLGVQTARELWENFSSLETIFEVRIAGSLGMEPIRGRSRKKADETPFDRLRAKISIPDDEQAWGRDWPGVDPSAVTDRFAKITPPVFDPEASRAAAALGLELTPGMTGKDIYLLAHEAFTELEGPARLSVDASYRSYIGELGAQATAAENEIRKLAFKQDLTPEYNELVQDFMTYENIMDSRFRGVQYGVPQEEQLDVQGRFMDIAQAGSDLNFDFDRIWKMRYERKYGVLGWEPPEPPGVTENSYRAVVHRVIDGDTVEVRPVVGNKQGHTVRLLGTRARDFGLDNEGAADDKDRLVEALQAGIRAGLPIYFVRQPEVYGSVDPYNRELSWLYIGDEPFFFPEELDPRRDPGGGS